MDRSLQNTVQMRTVTTLSLALMLSSPASAASFVTVQDANGTIASRRIRSNQDLSLTADEVLDYYEASGFPLPDVLSVWTAFPLGGSRGGTYFVPMANDISGIGLRSVYGVQDELFDSPRPPVRAVLLHNDFYGIEEGAIRHRAPTAGYGEYLFLLELSHVWGPAMQVAAANPSVLIGFPFHWSFYLNAPGPGGGNQWVDNGDGTFTTDTPPPGEVTFSMLDLYTMGLAEASEVPPVELLFPTAPPQGVTDPIWGGQVQARTFPWFDAAPLTVEANVQTYSIDDLIAANGERVPSFEDAPKVLDLGIVLVVTASATPAEIAAAEADFEPFAAGLAPRYREATRDRGWLRVVSSDNPQLPDAGFPDTGVLPDAGSGMDAGVDAGVADSGSAPQAEEGEGCRCVRPRKAPPVLLLAGLLLLPWRRRR